MKILLVDDSLAHRKAGEVQLTNAHNLTTVADYTEAVSISRNSVFDVALLDLLMPSETMTLGAEGLKFLGEEIPVGFPLAIKMAVLGIPHIIVATDTNHHDHPASAIVDWFGSHESIKINDSTVHFIHSPLTTDCMKDWHAILTTFIP